jgi:hypothetical protein
MDSFHVYSIGHMPGSSNIVVTRRSANFAACVGYRSPETIDARIEVGEIIAIEPHLNAAKILI